ncbi:uncharacterized protein LOC26526202 [Drosophila erecta]|uniref:Single domain-containing protein n=1 Tax=Drosophila erecta TaxID=7220 RepID=A0A0Q5WIY2_DROER|nr:uncharacterized protein LOC26526202 [Drosophila erecta]KQS70997.1 uncharacterized protein Dere_GG26378 [Drosophila erecta]
MRPATVLLVAIAALLVSGYEAAVSQGVFKDPAHPGKCVLEGLVLENGQIARHPQRCERIICGENSVAEIQSCGAYGLPPGKKFGKFTDPKADYPVCCNREIIDQ